MRSSALRRDTRNGHTGFRRISMAAMLGAVMLVAACADDEPQMISAPPVVAPPPVVAVAPPPPPPSPAVATPAPVPVVAAPPATTGRFAVHLASYYSRPVAERGWDVLTKRYRSLKPLNHRVVDGPVVKGKPVLRLLAGDFPTRPEAARLCAWAKQQKIYCQVMPL